MFSRLLWDTLCHLFRGFLLLVNQYECFALTFECTVALTLLDESNVTLVGRSAAKSQENVSEVNSVWRVVTLVVFLITPIK